MARARRDPVLLAAGVPGGFPDPRLYDAEGLVAYGGDLTPQRLVDAYSRGIFPWYGPGYVPLWWSPDPRALLSPETLHVSRSLRRVLRRGDFVLAWNTRFRQVMLACSERRSDGTWILPEMVDAYERLQQLGHAHSLEVLRGGQLVGGIYGVQVGALFAAESMFHRRTDMSKVALVALVHSLFAAGVRLLDVQFATEHLRSLGAVELPRADYLDRVRAVRDEPAELRKLVPSLPV